MSNLPIDWEPLPGPDPWEKAAALIAVAFLLLVLVLLGGCGNTIPPVLCPPVCLQPTETPTPTVSPTGTATSTPTSSHSPTATSTPTSPPAGPTPFQTTGGRALFDLDLSGFEPISSLDSYAFLTLCWNAPQPPTRPTTDCVQLGLRGLMMPPCVAKPCGGAMAVEVRASSNLYYDGFDIDPNTPGTQLRPESQMCGEGTRPAQWLPLGTSANGVFPIAVSWGQAFGGVRVETQVAAVTMAQGLQRPGLGWWIEGIPCEGNKCGIGWTYKREWTAQSHGASVVARSWQSVAPLGLHGRCP